MVSALKIVGCTYLFYSPSSVCAFTPIAVSRPRYYHQRRLYRSGENVHRSHHDNRLHNDRNLPSDSQSNINQSTSKPRLSSAIERLMQWIIENILFRQCSSLDISMNAQSNKSILKGHFDRVSISARECTFRFQLLSFKRLDLNGVNLHLGYLPFLVPVLPFFIWRLRGYIQSTIMTAFLLRITGYLENDNFRRYIRSMKTRIRSFIGSPRPPCIRYSMAITTNDVNNSLMLRYWLRNILQTLVQNSVVGAAAAIGDVAQQSIEAEKRRKQNAGIPLLPSSSAASLSNLPAEEEQQQQGLTSALLSATSFELTNTGFMKDGKVVFDAKAVLPRDENGERNSLQFCIRTKLAPTAVMETNDETLRRQDEQQMRNAIGFLSPECRLATNPLYAPISGLRNLVPNLIPEYLWLPFGVGVAVPLGRKCEIYRAEVDDCKEGSGYICKIDGSVNARESNS